MYWHRKSVTYLGFLAVLSLGQPGIAWAQEQSEPLTGEGEPVEQVDLRTPLASALGFMRFAENGDYVRAAEYLDLRYLPNEIESANGATLAEQL